MFKINENYLKLQGNYLFSEIAKKVDRYSKSHPDREIIRLGIGDVTLPLAPAVIEAMHKAVDEMAARDKFVGKVINPALYELCRRKRTGDTLHG